MITTPRLILRSWQDSDRAPFNAMGRDPGVMQHLGPLQTGCETDAVIDRLSAVEAATATCPKWSRNCPASPGPR